MKIKTAYSLFCFLLLIPIISTIATANQPPLAPDIEGSSSGQAGVQYTYGFCSSDPDGDRITIYVNWGDTSSEESIGPFPSGVCATATHTWSKQGTFLIKAKASDGQAESEWSTLVVTMPTNKIVHSLVLLKLFNQVSNVFPLLKIFLFS